jgi:hypothetical protein
MIVPSLFLDICHIELLHRRSPDTGRDIYKRELEQAGKTKDNGLTIIDYCINHNCYLHEVCAVLDWDVRLFHLPSLRLLQEGLMKEGKIDRPFVN